MVSSPVDLGRVSKFFSVTKDPLSDEYSRVTILLVAVLFTGILMWSYSLNSFFTISDYYHLKKLCFFYSLVHLLSPLIYKIKPSIRLVTHVFIAAGFLFQFHHGMATGGFKGETLIWFSVLPLIVGIVASLSDMLIWSSIAVAGILLQFVLTEAGYAQSGATPAGELWAKLNIALGYIMINLALIVSYINFRDRTMRALEIKQNKIRSLIRILAHDINNPLGLIVFSNEFLKAKNPNDSDLHKFIKKIDVGTNHILAIVNSTRDYEQLTSSKKRLSLEGVNVEEALDEALVILEERLTKKRITIHKNIQKGMIKVDRSAFISQVLLNILTNAVKFSFERSTIEIRGFSTAKGYQLEVKDAGTGMPPDVLENLFAEYVITTTPGTQGEKGTGFGMPIANQVMKQLGGELVVTSSQQDPGRGTVFKIILKDH